jgi:hypothetical protein
MPLNEIAIHYFISIIMQKPFGYHDPNGFHIICKCCRFVQSSITMMDTEVESAAVQTEPLSPALPTNRTQQNTLLETQNHQTDVRQGAAQSGQAMLSDQNNFVDTQNSSDLSKPIAPKDQKTTVPTKPTKQQLLEAEIDKAFNEVFEIDQQNPTEDNPHAAVFDEMADDLYQTMLQEQAKEEAAAGLTPIPNQAKAPDSSTQGWTNDSNIQYNMQEELSAAPIAQQEHLRQFWDETKQRFSAVKLLFGTQPYGSFQPAFAVADGKGLPDYSNDDAASHINEYANKLSNAFQLFATQERNNALKDQKEKNQEIKIHSDNENFQKNIKLPENSSQQKHIFRDAAGHLADTSANRRIILDVANDPDNFLGTDIRGNNWYAKTRRDGSQIWVRVRNGIVDNAGMNTNPRIWDPETGLYHNTKRQNGRN